MFKLWKRMAASTVINHNFFLFRDYETTLATLFNLQSNTQDLKLPRTKETNKFKQTEEYLLRTGITTQKLDTLSVIHVAGTKGKGSSCAYTEAILRQHGYTTGLYSSPHLVSVRERIRINGKPISESVFIKYFWEVYRKLENLNVDVAIIETGIGGLYDCTNIIRNPVCVGITSLALDHTKILGSTLKDIAYQKAGIFKHGAIAFSVPQCPPAMSVLKTSADKLNCSLHIIPPFEEYRWKNLSPILKIKNLVQQENASLAIQMATTWLMSKNNEYTSIVSNIIDRNEYSIRDMDKIAIALSSCKWPGRMQILKSSIGKFFLDGAHTNESIQCCISWFNDFVVKSDGERNILIFNTSKERNPRTLMMPLRALKFEKVYFVPNYAGNNSVEDEFNQYSLDKQIFQCIENTKFWGENSIAVNSVSKVLQEIKEANYNIFGKCNVLVTGSLHLVGAVLAVLDPHLTMRTQF